jgi:hypothetical protein
MVTPRNAPRSIQAIKGMFFFGSSCLFDIIYPSQYRYLPRVWGHNYGTLLLKIRIFQVFYRDRIGNKQKISFKSNSFKKINVVESTIYSSVIMAQFKIRRI